MNDDEKRKYEVTKKAYKDGRREYENKINQGGCLLGLAVLAPIFVLTFSHNLILTIVVFIVFLYLGIKR